LEEGMSARTAFLGKFIGIYLILISLPMAINKQSTLETVMAMVHNGPVVFVVGLMLVALGVAMILSHNVWSGGGALAIIVTLVGWLTLIKGLLFLFLPTPAAVGVFLWGPTYERYFYVDVAIAFILGVYLTYGSFRSGSNR
jgi:hypothetical protein